MFVKFCGITTLEDALLATAVGTDAVGFVFAPSVRQVAPKIVKDIVQQLPHEVMTVGVFRDQSREQVVNTVNSIGLRAAQLHGHETPEDCQWVADRVPITIRALSIDVFEIGNLEEFPVDLLLFDSPEPGSGMAFDWSRIRMAAGNQRFLLAGGLNPANVNAAVEAAKPFGVDVSSGIEAKAGKKDPRRMKAFIEAVRSIDVSSSRNDSCGDEEGAFNLDSGR